MEELQELCEDLAEEGYVDGIVCPTRICKKNRITLIHKKYGEDNFDGMLVFKSGKWFILCNIERGNRPGSTRERFTISHELGHYNIPEHRRFLMAGGVTHGSKAGAFDAEGSIEELEADTFAANLLMPPSRFTQRIKSLKIPPLQATQILRKEFKTSLESCAIHCMKHDSRILTIALWNDEGLNWHWISDPAFKESGYRSFKIRAADHLMNDCSTIQSLRDRSEVFENVIHETATTACHCFNQVAGGESRDIVIREESLRNGHFGVLTMYSVHPVQ